MKKTMGLMLCGMLSIYNVNSNAQTSTFSMEHLFNGIDKIILDGKMNPHGIRRGGPEDIVAFLQGDRLFAQFNYNVGLVEVTIKDSFGIVVFSEIVDSACGQMDISTSGWSSQNYSITFNNKSGSMWGSFELQ